MPMTLSGDGTITGLAAGGLPDNSITQSEIASGVAGKGPAFSARPSTTQTITSAVITKVTLDVETFDTNNNFASSTFTPTVAGYYQVNATLAGYATTTITNVIGHVYKNGASYLKNQIVTSLTANNATTVQISDVIYLNGSTDYIELYGSVQGTGTISFQTNLSAFSAFLARAS